MKDGESLAIVHLAKSLRDLGHEVVLLAMNTSKHPAQTAEIEAAEKIYSAVETVEIDNRLKVLPALQNLFSEKSYHIQRFESQGFAKKLERLLLDGDFEIVQLETPYLAPYLPEIRRFSDAKIVMRAHNVEHEIWERMAENAPFFKKWYLQKITPRLRDFEIDNLNRYDFLAAISERDVEQFQNLGMIIDSEVLPIGLDCSEYLPDFGSFSRPLSLSFIGSLDWMPNLEGLRWFLDEIWKPILSEKFPALELHIAGRNTPAWLKNLNLKNVRVHGEVADSKKFINQHSMMIVPLLSGSGMRAKILEGMALGKVCLTTSVGLEGIPARNRQEILVADSPEAFAQQIFFAVEQPEKIKKIGKAARKFCEENYDNSLIGKKLVQIYENLVAVEETTAA